MFKLFEKMSEDDKDSVVWIVALIAIPSLFMHLMFVILNYLSL